MARSLGYYPALIGQRFGRLVVVRFHDIQHQRTASFDRYECQCDCGKTCIARRTALVNKQKQQSCGCAKFEKFKAYREVTVGESHPNYRGGSMVNKDGYVMVLDPARLSKKKRRGYVFEHRLVMEQYIGRKLLPTETVHHKNGVRSDNRIENLELKVTAHGPGVPVSDIVAYALEMLRRYAPEYLKDEE